MGKPEQRWLLVTDPTTEREMILRRLGVQPRFLPPFRVQYHAPDLSPLIRRPELAVVISSRHAVEAFRRHPKSASLAPGRLFVVGGHTAALAEAAGLGAARPFDRLEDLLRHLSAERRAAFIHLCGDKTIPEMHALLAATGIGRIPVTMYTTELLQPEAGHIAEDAVLFFSPSGVQSFFAQNRLPSGIRIGVIGATTAAALAAAGLSADLAATHPHFETFANEMAALISESIP